MRRPDVTQALILLEVAERHRGEDDPRRFFRKLARTLNDVLDGRPVRPWRLDRLREYMEDVSNTCLRKMSEGRGGCF